MVLEKEFEKEGNWLFRRRSLLPLSVLLLGVAVQWFTVHDLSLSSSAVLVHWHVYEELALLVELVGLTVRIFTVGFTPKGTSGRNTAGQEADTLNTTGVYSVVRHPLYVGNFLMWLSVAMLTCNVGFVVSFVLAYWLYYERIMYAEEQYLSRKFGESYVRWAAETPAVLPRLGHYTPSVLAFSWKKVVKKEKNGVFALFLLFSVFDGIVAWLCPWIQPNKALLAMTVASGVAYLVLKWMKKHTRLLDEQGR